MANDPTTQKTENASLFDYWAKMTTTFNAFISWDKVLDCIQIWFDGGISKPIIDAAYLTFNSHCQQLQTRIEDN